MERKKRKVGLTAGQHFNNLFGRRPTVKEATTVLLLNRCFNRPPTREEIERHLRLWQGKGMRPVLMPGRVTLLNQFRSENR